MTESETGKEWLVEIVSSVALKEAERINRETEDLLVKTEAIRDSLQSFEVIREEEQVKTEIT